MSGDAANERTPLVVSSADNPTAWLYSGELGPDERENLSNQLQEEAEWRIQDDDNDVIEDDDEVNLLRPSTSNLQPPATHQPCWKRHKRFLTFLVVFVLVISANLLAIYLVYFHNCVRLKVLAYNVWGMPGGLGGCKDKTQRIAALANEISEQRLGQGGDDFDLILLEELWMEPDHTTIKSLIPEGFYMTEFRDLASSVCDGRVLITSCSGLAVISRYPFVEKEFHEYTWKGSIWDGEAFAGKGVGRVRIQPKSDVTIDVFVTHTIADGTTMYNNSWARIKQVEELMDSYILKSDADAVILGGDFNTGPSELEGSPFQIITSRGMTNSVQEIFYQLDAWLQTEFSTYGNPRNDFSNMYPPIIYDYIFHRTVSKHTVCWTNWFELPLFTTVLFGGAGEQLLLRGDEGSSNDTSSSSSWMHSSAANLSNGETLTIPLSDHEPVISTLYVRKFSPNFPYL